MDDTSLPLPSLPVLSAEKRNKCTAKIIVYCMFCFLCIFSFLSLSTWQEHDGAFYFTFSSLTEAVQSCSFWTFDFWEQTHLKKKKKKIAVFTWFSFSRCIFFLFVLILFYYLRWSVVSFVHLFCTVYSGFCRDNRCLQFCLMLEVHLKNFFP